MKDLVISYPAGSSGHFVALITNYLLHGREIFLSKTGPSHTSSHGETIAFPILDQSQEEIEKFFEIHRNKIIIVHYQNLDHLLSIDKKIIFVTVKEENIEKISNNVNRKLDLFDTLCREDLYNFIKGADWPELSKFKSFTIDQAKPYIEEFKYLNLDYNKKWKYFLSDKNNKNLLEIRWEDIFYNSDKIINNIANFLNVKVTNQQCSYINKKIKQYIEKDSKTINS